MTIFASKTPRDLNHDPEPMLEPGGKRAGILEAVGTYEPGPFGRLIEGPRYDPRPEFDHAQHNEPNPILSGNLREAVALDARENPPILDLAETARYILNATYDEPSFEECYTPAQINHARRVLARLANLEGAPA